MTKYHRARVPFLLFNDDDDNNNDFLQFSFIILRLHTKKLQNHLKSILLRIIKITPVPTREIPAFMLETT